MLLTTKGIVMSKVIRISDDLYKRLEAHATGFDTPSNVIEIILNAYESNFSSTESDRNSVRNTVNQSASDQDIVNPTNTDKNIINIHDEIKKLAPNLNEKFKDGDMYYAGNVYPTKERVKINGSGAIILTIGSEIGEHLSKILEDNCVAFTLDQGRYKCYNATNLRNAGLIE